MQYLFLLSWSWLCFVTISSYFIQALLCGWFCAVDGATSTLMACTAVVTGLTSTIVLIGTSAYGFSAYLGNTIRRPWKFSSTLRLDSVGTDRSMETGGLSAFSFEFEELKPLDAHGGVSLIHISHLLQLQDILDSSYPWCPAGSQTWKKGFDDDSRLRQVDVISFLGSLNRLQAGLNVGG